MNKILIMIVLITLSIKTNAQNNSDKKFGRYIKSDAKNLYIGNWISIEAEKGLEVLLTTKKMRNKFKEYDYYYDALYIKILKCIYKGEDISKKIIEPIILPSGDKSKYGSMFFKDEVTGDDIIIKLYYVDKNTLKLNVNTKYSPGTASVLPLGDTILKRKSK